MDKQATEDQPLPGEGAAVTPPTEIMQGAVNVLAQTLVKKFEANGNVFNALEAELRQLVLIETMHMLVALVIELSAGKYNDDMITLTVAERVRRVTGQLEEQLLVPRILAPAAMQRRRQ